MGGNRSAPGLLATALGVGLVFFATEAHAVGPLDVEIGARAGVGSNIGLGIDPLGLGLGARAGVSVLGLYGGVNVMYYFGTDENVSPPPGGPTSDFIHTLLYGVEGGYGIRLLDDSLTLRAQLGIGNAEFNSNDTIPGSFHGLYLEPGVLGMFASGRWFVGADVNALVFVDTFHLGFGPSTRTSLTVHGQVGVVF